MVSVPFGFSATFAFLGGACVGSFLNVVAWRVPMGRSIVWPGSACPECGAAIAWYDNLPILSYLALGRRCRNCLTPISPRYAIVELATAAIAVLCVLRFGLSLHAGTTFILSSFAIALSVMDLELWVLPSEVTRMGTVVGLLLAGVTQEPTLKSALIGTVVGWAVLTSLSFVASLILKQEAMGAGDPALLAMIGAFLGWPSLLPVVLLASLQASVVGLFLLAFRGQAHLSPDVEHADGWVPPATALPFGPYLSLAALEYALLELGRFDPTLALFS
jgi:leader peptidase (prepilin peptidase)/N-methyltransferase